MKKHWLYILLTVVFIAHIRPVPVTAEIIDSVVAVVNDDIVTRSDVNRIGKPIFQQIFEEAPLEQQKEAVEQARKKIIAQLIENKLLIQQAAALNISVSETEITQAKKQVQQRNNFTDEEFRDELRKMGLSKAQYRESLRDQILRSKLISYEIQSKIVIPEKEIQRYFKEQYSNTPPKVTYYVLQCGVSWDEKQPSARAISVAEKNAFNKVQLAHQLAQKGQDFKEVVRQYSNLASAADGGDLGSFTKDEMAKYMQDAITVLQPGDISPIIHRPHSYIFFKLLKKELDTNNTKQVLDKKLKEEIRNKLYKQEAEKRYTVWLKKIRNEAYVKIL
ncbi:MAG: SurA N-terminal domain-containing protein [Candidatus Electrothrix gigas]